MNMKKGISLEEARESILAQINCIKETEEDSLYEVGNKVVAQDYMAMHNQPPFDRSPLDGFALSAEAVREASRENPVTLAVKRKIYAGDSYQFAIEEKEAVRIMTGAGIPEGADCVIRQEDVSYGEGYVTISQSMQKHENICDAGEDVRKGKRLIEKGEIITPPYAAILAGQGYFTVNCYRSVKIGVLSTGSELSEEKELKPGQIYNSNAVMISLRLQQFGMKVQADYCNDSVETIKQKILQLLNDQDFVITTGGVSVGEKDYLPGVMEELGAEILFHGICMKPGSPMMAARINGKMVFCLSGNPFAAMATLELIALPGLLKASGRKRYFPVIEKGFLENCFLKASKKGRRFIRAWEKQGRLHIPENHSSGSIASMAGCNCMIDIPAGTGELENGCMVNYWRFLSDENTVEEVQQEKTLPVLCICGRKNTGKTTFMEKLVTYLSQKGYCIGVMKHDGHDFVPDVPQTDSFRAGRAGSRAVMVYSEKRMMFYQTFLQDKNRSEEENLKKMVSSFINTVECKLDLIIVEGGKNSDYPKVEMVRKEISDESIAKEPVFAICTDCKEVKKKDKKIEIFSLEQYEKIAEKIIDDMLK